jgi:hypothetical protein
VSFNKNDGFYQLTIEVLWWNNLCIVAKEAEDAAKKAAYEKRSPVYTENETHIIIDKVLAYTYIEEFFDVRYTPGVVILELAFLQISPMPDTCSEYPGFTLRFAQQRTETVIIKGPVIPTSIVETDPWKFSTRTIKY